MDNSKKYFFYKDIPPWGQVRVRKFQGTVKYFYKDKIKVKLYRHKFYEDEALNNVEIQWFIRLSSYVA